MRRCTLLLALLAGCAADADGDGVRANKDCNDADPRIYPGAPELCDGFDSDCDGGDEPDADGDGYRVCAECDDTRADVFPGAPSTCDGTDADCDGTVSDAENALEGEDAACPSTSCGTLRETRPDVPDGTYWVDGATDVPAFEVDCDMRSDGGGWTRLSLIGDGVLVGSNDPSNAWHKCADDAVAPWPWLPDEPDVPEDYPGVQRVDELEPWVRPSDGYRYAAYEVQALAGSVTELHADLSLVASTNDDDGRSWQDGDGGGLEVYALGIDGSWFLLTPGTGGECGGASGWPAEGVDGMQYRWSMAPGASTWQGTQADDAGEVIMSPLPPELAMPIGFVLATFTGGGVAVGYDNRLVRVR